MKRRGESREPAARKGRRRAVDARHEWAATQAAPDEIVCRLCGNAYRSISFTHLRRAHGWRGAHPIEDYKRQFGLPAASCRSTLRSMRRAREDFWERHGQHWPRERVLAELKSRAAEGKPLASGRLDVAFALAIRRRFGTWERAMRRAGLDPDAHRLKGRWTKARIVSSIRGRRDAGRSLAASVVDAQDPALYRAGIRNHGNWGATLRAVGLDPQEHLLPSKWNMECARAWVRARHAAGGSILSSRVPSGLLGAVMRETGGAWVAFVDSLGIPYPGHRKRLDWSKAAVVAEIQKVRRAGLPLNNRAVRDGGGEALVLQARKRFGSWDGALRSAGVDPTTVRLWRAWTDDRVLKAIRARKRSKGALDRVSVRAEDESLLQAAEGRFKTWTRALAAAGLDPAYARASAARRRRRG